MLLAASNLQFTKPRYKFWLDCKDRRRSRRPGRNLVETEFWLKTLARGQHPLARGRPERSAPAPRGWTGPSARRPDLRSSLRQGGGHVVAPRAWARGARHRSQPDCGARVPGRPRSGVYRDLGPPLLGARRSRLPPPRRGLLRSRSSRPRRRRRRLRTGRPWSPCRLRYGGTTRGISCRCSKPPSCWCRWCIPSTRSRAPPFPVPESEVRALFGDRRRVRHLGEEDIIERSSLRKRGVTRLYEHTYLIE